MRALAVADQMIRIIGLEGEAEQRRDRTERDIALVQLRRRPRLRALEIALQMMPLSQHRRGVGAGFGLVNPKAGNLASVGKARQPLLLLILVPKPSRVRPDPASFGTITVTAAVGERDEILRTTSECA